MTVTVSRRGILRCLGGLIAAPAVVKADALMRIVAPKGLTFRGVTVAFDEVQFETYTSHFYCMNQLPPANWRYVARISNISEELSQHMARDILRALPFKPAGAACDPANRAAAADPGLDPVASTAADLPRRLSRPAS